MQFEGTVRIGAPRQKVWEFVTDAFAVSECIPGIRETTTVQPGKEYGLRVTADLGAVQPTFDLKATFTLAQPPREARLRIRGKGLNSYIGASTYMVLSELDNGSTEMYWTFVIAASGQVASIGERIINNVFHKLSGQFIARMQEHLEDRVEQPLRLAV